MPQIADTQFIDQVNEAYKAYGSVLALSRLPLAATPLIEPALVLDPLTPTPEDRGRALQLALQWALLQLAPATPRYPLGEYRPLDDPTWRDPAWWRYNILRHRYVEPLHPDDFIEGGRYTETLMALTGLATPDAFYDERNRAVRAAAAVLPQLTTPAARTELQQQSLTALCTPLTRQPELFTLLGIAAVLEGVFPRTLLVELAATEQLPEPAATLQALTTARYILTGDDGASLWMSPVLRDYIYQHTERARLRVRHVRVAAYYTDHDEPLAAAHHLRVAEQWRAAADQLLAAAMGDDLPAALRAEVTAFPLARLDAGRRYRLQVLLSDLYTAGGEGDAAIDACRAALPHAQTPAERGALFRRMGKLYVMRNQLHALAYYRQAEATLSDADAELVTLLKDRGWLHIHRRAWQAAAADLNRALTLTPTDASATRADVLDALAALHRYQHDLTAAITCAQQALALREQSGDLLHVAKSLGNLGLLYTATGEHAHAVTAHQEARIVAQRLGNPELAVTATLNIGLAYHLAGDRAQAVAVYRECLAQARENNFVLAELRALSNLAEALAELGDLQAAHTYWQHGVEVARRDGFDDECAYLQELADRFGFDTPPSPVDVTKMLSPERVLPAADLLNAEDALALDLARREGRVTPRRLMEAAHLSKATATRRLTALAAAGLLTPVGRGRGTSYVIGRLEIRDWEIGRGGDQAKATEGDASPHALNLQSPNLQSPNPSVSLSPDLCARYGILAAGWVVDAPIVALRFAVLPELLAFLALRAEVQREVGAAVEVLPVEALHAEQRVVWVEREA